MEDPQCARLIVKGRVQGVFFRASTQARARALGLRGWVRNRQDGAVEATAWGDRATLELWVGFCRRGPPDARVDRIDVEFEAWDVTKDDGPPPGFTVRR